MSLKVTLERSFFLSLAIIFMLFYAPAKSFAQQDMEDVVYLMNGSVIRGSIIEQIPNRSIKIQTRDGSIFVYDMSSIVKITKELRVSVSHEDGSVDNIPLGKSAVLLNPLGVFQFGPIIEGELGTSSNIFLTAHLRYSAFGLVYRALVTDDPLEDEVSLTSAAVGVGIKKFIERYDSPNCFYLGSQVEYGWGSSNGGSWEEIDRYFVFMGRFGYRWRYPSKLFMNLGIMSGLVVVTKSEWWYVSEPDRKYDDPGTSFMAMLEFSVGWETE